MIEAGIEECQECKAHISWIDAAYACDLGCTFCPECTAQFGYTCPNCSGQLSIRPRQTRPPAGATIR